MTCFVCNEGSLIRKMAKIEGKVKRSKYTVETLALVCDHCGHIAMEGEDTPEYLRKLADTYRKEHKLLTSAEIRHIRRGLSQQRFADALRVGVASVKRWELGLVQDKGHDKLMRDFDLRNTPIWNYETASAGSGNYQTEDGGLWPFPNGPPDRRVARFCRKQNIVCVWQLH